ncbi:ROK family transcriptional regulator [Nocardioides sp.]|uniref:ROK family transcriptional regulator n=1 Tax=Nocardioides sp. TaxID=35761 RepID=UPI002C083F93|nr:ROK family transcriptional regulator [Nocardioides sp.]HXH77842.1 ROK family transcriptional regulator [Nocardioides sp.]
MTGRSLEALRMANQRAVTSLLSLGDPLSRAELARRTGLSSTTVSSLVAQLMGGGVVEECEGVGLPYKGGSGRPPRLLRLTTRPGLVAGVDAGHHHVRVAIADRAANILVEHVAEVDVDPEGQRTLDLVADMVARAALEADVRVEQLLGIGMCVPSPLNRASHRVSSGILPGWRGLVPAEELQRRTGLPVIADNDANVGAIAEHQHGAARGAADAIYVKAASGLGAGLILGGRLHRGATGIAGELGHVHVREDGRVCRCGSRGCLETEVSAQHLLTILRHAYGDDLDVATMMSLEAEEDPGVCRVLGDAGRTIGRALADLCTALNPSTIVVGGSIGASPVVRDGIRSALDRHAHPDSASAVCVVPGQLGARAEVVGAVTLAIAGLAAAD